MPCNTSYMKPTTHEKELTAIFILLLAEYYHD